MFGLAYLNHAKAQELGSGDMGVPESVLIEPTGELAQSDPASPFYSSFYPEAMLNQHMPGGGFGYGDTKPQARSFGRPLLVLPVPPLVNGMFGFHFPGSYMPRGTPLHGFNGYVVCNPPNLSREITLETAAGAPARRLAKITSTRSPSTPGYPGPCPVYTINGELPQQKSHSTITLPSTGNAPARQQGEHR